MTDPRSGGGGATPAPPAARRRAIVVGAGIAGLACAHRLATLGRERRVPVDIVLLEASGRAGGVISTETTGGFLVEGGPDCFISEKPWALDLCRRLGLEPELIGTNPDCRRSFVLRRGRVLPIPEGFQLMAPARLMPFLASPVISPLGKLRLACDLLLPRGAGRRDESLASFVIRRFGREALEALAQPLVAGIYTAEPEALSLRATMPRFLEMERDHRSIILALLRARRKAGAAQLSGVSGARYSLFMTLRDGLQTLVGKLESLLPPGTLRLGAPVASIASTGADGMLVVTTASGGRLPADDVVLALPAPAAAPLLRDADARLADLLAAIPYGTSITVSLGYRRADVPHPLDGFGIVIPRSEKRSLIACSFSSVKFAGRAPEGTVLLRAFASGRSAGADGAAADHGRIEALARHDLREILGITASPIMARTCIWPRAMAQYGVGHLDVVSGIEERLALLPGLALAGNGLHGVGIPDCVRSGERAAEAIARRWVIS